MEFTCKADFLDYFEREWEMNGKKGVSHKIAVLNDKFFSDKDRVINWSVKDDLVSRYSLTDRNLVSKMVGKTFDFVLEPRVEGKNFTFVIVDFRPSTKKENLPLESEPKK